METIVVAAVLTFVGVIVAVYLYRLFTGKVEAGCGGGCAGCGHSGGCEEEKGKDAGGRQASR